MYLSILILAELTRGPAHGYELRRRVSSTMGGRVNLNGNTLYPALRRFEADGTLIKRVEQQSGFPDRLVYELTETGRAKLNDMLLDFDDTLAQSDEEFLTRVAFFNLVDPPDAVRILDTRTNALERRIAFLDGLEESTPTDLDGEGAYSQRGRMWQESVLDYSRDLVRAERRWLNDLRGQLDRSMRNAKNPRA
ncbi:PadR family transcriptional regulator [Nocardia sp. NPDC005825]|uniref:PadR family transcriptional regulator n=1 Tax=unclassified Nocardia TaxID=2637762 RepID=UPI0033DEC440